MWEILEWLYRCFVMAVLVLVPFYAGFKLGKFYERERQ